MITEKTRRLVLRRHKALCDALTQLELEHGSRLCIYAGGGRCVCDSKRLGDHHEGRLAAAGGTNYEDGGAIVVHLPYIGPTWEGGDF